MKKIILLCFTFSYFLNPSLGQDFGIEIQQYPTGFLFGVRGEVGLKAHHAIDFRLGYNSLDHRDLGVQENEEGGGFGGTIGYRYYFQPEHHKFFLGARTDLWFNSVDWINSTEFGNTKITVLQPTAILGYLFLLNEKFVLTPTAALGAEINIKTEGAEVGQGAILLWGINLAYRF